MLSSEYNVIADKKVKNESLCFKKYNSIYMPQKLFVTINYFKLKNVKLQHSDYFIRHFEASVWTAGQC